MTLLYGSPWRLRGGAARWRFFLPYEDYQASTQTIPLHVAKLISENDPLRGKEAAQAMRQHLASMGNQAAKDGLTEADVMRMVNEE